MNDEQRRANREDRRRTRLRARLRAAGRVDLPEGWRVAPSRTAHLFVDDRPACGVSWVDDGSPPPAPIYLCGKCRRIGVQKEDWSEFEP